MPGGYGPSLMQPTWHEPGDRSQARQMQRGERRRCTMNFKISLDSHKEKDNQIVSSQNIFLYVEEFEAMAEARDEAVYAINEAAGDALFLRTPDGRRPCKFAEENVEGSVHMRLFIETEDGRNILHITVEEEPA